MNVYIVSTFYVITHFTLIWRSSDWNSWSTHAAILNNVNKLCCEEKHCEKLAVLYNNNFPHS